MQIANRGERCLWCRCHIISCFVAITHVDLLVGYYIQCRRTTSIQNFVIMRFLWWRRIPLPIDRSLAPSWSLSADWFGESSSVRKSLCSMGIMCGQFASSTRGSTALAVSPSLRESVQSILPFRTTSDAKKPLESNSISAREATSSLLPVGGKFDSENPSKSWMLTACAVCD